MIVSAVVFFLQSECVDDDDENNAHRSVPILGVEVGMVLCSLSRLFIPLPPALRGEVGSCTSHTHRENWGWVDFLSGRCSGDL